jgi:hypothetical protein
MRQKLFVSMFPLLRLSSGYSVRGLDSISYRPLSCRMNSTDFEARPRAQMISLSNKRYRPGSSSSFVYESTTITTTGSPIPANSNQPQYHFKPSRLHQYIANDRHAKPHFLGRILLHLPTSFPRPHFPNTALQIRGSESRRRNHRSLTSTFPRTATHLPPRFPVSVIMLLLPCRYFAEATLLSLGADIRLAYFARYSMRKDYWR